MENSRTVTVFGVGYGGIRILNAIKSKIPDDSNLNLISVSTDLKNLEEIAQTKTIFLNSKFTMGLNCGGDIQTAIKVMEEEANQNAIKEEIEKSDVVVIVSAFGGGTGTGISPVIAKMAYDNNKKVLSFITLPFMFEGKRRRNTANEGIEDITTFSLFNIYDNETLLEDIRKQDKNPTLAVCFDTVDEKMSGIILTKILKRNI